MKALLLALLLAAPQAQAATVLGAELRGQNLHIDLQYGGGCKEHTFSLDLGGCLESNPVQCSATVVDNTRGDHCEALIGTEFVISLKDAGIVGDYYSNGSLTIRGSNNSSATVRLPADLGATPPRRLPRRPREPVTECITHTGSKLQIKPSSDLVSLETVDGEVAEFAIVDIDSVSLESNPPIAQTTYSLEDGRKIVTQFRGESRGGTGYFVRLNGEASPEFSCSSR